MYLIGILVIIVGQFGMVLGMITLSPLRDRGLSRAARMTKVGSSTPRLLNNRVFGANGHRLYASKPEFDKEVDKKYFEYARLEESIYEWWEKKGYFKPIKDNGKKPYVIPMPPPNVTGYLHMGHAMFVALQDIMARFHRMRGKPTLWLPGTDHAGIATQLLVERQLKVEGTTRQEMGREKFLERIWKWKEEKGEVS